MGYAIRNDRQGWRAVGGPEDIMEGEVYSGTQPDETAADPIEAALAAIETKYAPKFGALKDRLLTVTMADGPDQEAKTSALRQEWAELSDQMATETMQALEGGE